MPKSYYYCKETVLTALAVVGLYIIAFTLAFGLFLMFSQVKAADNKWSQNVIETAMAEVGDGYVECSSAFTVVAMCAAQRNDTAEIEAGYKKHAHKASMFATLSYNEAKISEEAVKAKTKFISQHVAGKLKGKCGNISVMFETLGKCVKRINNAPEYIQATVAKVAMKVKK